MIRTNIFAAIALAAVSATTTANATSHKPAPSPKPAITAASAPTHAMPDNGWGLLQKVDSLTDEKITAAYEAHKEGLYNRVAVLRCQGNQFQLRFEFGQIMTGHDRVEVKYRFDKGPLVDRDMGNRWDTTTTLEAVAPNDDDEAVNFAHQMMKASTLVFEVDSDQAYRATFDLTGAAEKIAQVLNACGKP